jgi:hypothetical protein
LATHLPGPPDPDDPTWANAAVGFCAWAREGILKAAEEKIEVIADALDEASVTLTLLAACRKMFALCSPETQFSQRGEIWDSRRFCHLRTLRPIEVELSAEEYEEAVRSRLALPEVKDRVHAVLAFDRNDLLTRIQDEFRRAASVKLPQATAMADVLPEQHPSPDETPKPPPSNSPGYIESLGNYRYRVGNETINAEQGEDEVLQAFLQATGNSLTKKQLGTAAKRDEGDCLRILRKLAGRANLPAKYDGLFAQFIKFPGGRGRGGYQVQIRSV